MFAFAPTNALPNVLDVECFPANNALSVFDIGNLGIVVEGNGKLILFELTKYAGLRDDARPLRVVIPCPEGCIDAPDW